MVLNTLMAFFIVNGLMKLPGHLRRSEVQSASVRLPALTQVHRGQPSPELKLNEHQMKWVDSRSFEGVPPEQVSQILSDFASFAQVGYAFHPYTHFSEPAFQSQTVNIQMDDKGYSYRASKSHPLSAKGTYQVYVFGGSTTLGWHTADNQTIPHYLAEALKKSYRKRGQTRSVTVTNFGKGYYSWFQEMILFQRLLHSGYRPDAVVFLDGVNVLHADSPNETPHNTKDLIRLWDKAQISSTALPNTFPLFKTVNNWARDSYRRLFRDFEQGRHPHRRTYSLPDWVAKTQQSYHTTLDQIEALTSLYQIQPYFVWQPNRAYLCQSSKYRQELPEEYRDKVVPLYTEMKQFKRPHFVYMGDLCRKMGFKKRLFIDDVHYSPSFNRAIAQELAYFMMNPKRVVTTSDTL